MFLVIPLCALSDQSLKKTHKKSRCVCDPSIYTRTGFVLGDRRTQTFSLISLGSTLPQSTRDPNSLGVRSIQSSYFIFALVVPLLHTLMLAILWLVPLSLRAQQAIFTAAEVGDGDQIGIGAK